MCVSAAPARLTNSLIYAGIVNRAGKRVHVMGYQNCAENLADGANCMLLHIPSVAPMSADNMVDTSACPSVLDDLVRSLMPIPRWRSAPAAGSAADVVHVFQKGIYTVVLSNRWELAHEALSQVPESKRPALSVELLRFYGEHFPGWHLALCCFDNRDAVTSDPLLWWYEPLFPATLMAPAIDAHTGGPPDLSAQVQRDHHVVFGTDEHRDGLLPVRLSGGRRYPHDVSELMPSRARLHTVRGTAHNGDFLLDVASLHKPGPPVRVGILTA
jgi:hypothetical protein